MSISKANATWEGTLKQGKGTMKPEHAGEVPFSVGTRFEGAQGSNPEELIGAALAGCFSMALSLDLEKAGITPQSIRTSANVHMERTGGGFDIQKIELVTEVRASGGNESKIKEVAEGTKANCPVAKLVKGAQVTLQTKMA